MERTPAQARSSRSCTRADTRWFIVAGLVMAVATLGVIAGRRERPTARALARTMGMTTFAIANLFFSFTARDELRSVFSLDTFGDRTFLTTSLLSAARSSWRPSSASCSAILDTVELTGNQWLICIGAGLTVIVASELWKLVLRHREPQQ